MHLLQQVVPYEHVPHVLGHLNSANVCPLPEPGAQKPRFFSSRQLIVGSSVSTQSPVETGVIITGACVTSMTTLTTSVETAINFYCKLCNSLLDGCLPRSMIYDIFHILYGNILWHLKYNYMYMYMCGSMSNEVTRILHWQGCLK